ncbi:flagellar export chaperone FliS [Thorsellia anophelis]|uniref:Flagellar secretion chaperone FliS n=1 Tax=Thorsellia anophelis DSM 18579 TaxID=1123402 RepID=A0A1H9ZEH9_9GAMM|nr:flagellar export chaperone FliS [Thorsellia anophelis]SES80060.1 flagellar protein FliS [Thorsellia anophelis DSM 18579]
MYSPAKAKTQSYENVGLESSVMSANPHQLITLLFDGAINALLRAKILIEQGDSPNHIAEKGSAISKSIGIIDNGLRASLNPEVDGELADNLDSLYGYMTDRLVQANLKNDVKSIEEVIKLLTNIADAWKEIDPNAPKS